MAAALLGQHVAAMPQLDGRIQVQPAGVHARPGDPPNPQAVLALAAQGIGLGKHQAARIETALLAWADLILTMNSELSSECVTRGAPQARTFTLHELLGGHGAVDGPFTEDLVAYRACAYQIDTLTARIAERLLEEQRLTQGPPPQPQATHAAHL